MFTSGTTKLATYSHGSGLLTRLAWLMVLALNSCGGTNRIAEGTTAQSIELLKSMEKALEIMSGRVRVLEQSVPLLACGPEIRALVRDIRKECNEGTRVVSLEVSPDSESALSRATCKTENIQGAIASAERDMDRSISQLLLTVFRHEVVYTSENNHISSMRQKRLANLAAEPRLPSTRYLVVTAPVNSLQDAEQRARTVMDLLIELGIPESETVFEGTEARHLHRFDRPWFYRLNISPQMLRPTDRPIPPEPRDTQRAVYIFRTDCN